MLTLTPEQAKDAKDRAFDRFLRRYMESPPFQRGEAFDEWKHAVEFINARTVAATTQEAR